MSRTDLHSVPPAVAAGVTAAVIGALTGGRLVERGLAQLEVTAPRAASPIGHVAGGLGGLAGVLAARHAGSWWLLPGLLVWAYALAAGAVCDALTQRVPTALVRHAALTTAALILGAAAASGHWRWVVLAAVGAVAASVIFMLCWRFLGTGFGDVRLAALAGVGLVGPTHRGLVAGGVAFTVITLGQAAVTLARGGNRRTTFPYGPAIAIAFTFIATI